MQRAIVARGINRLSAAALKALKKPGFHADGGGLYVRIRETGGRSFVFVSTKGGKRRETVIGPVHDLTLPEAREARDRLRRGKPLIVDAGFANFGEWADHWVGEHEAGWASDIHRRQWRQTFKEHAKALRPLALKEVDTNAIVGMLRELWISHNETASRVRGRIERVLDAAKAKGLIASPWENPARWRGHLSHLLPPRRKLSARGHQAAMPYKDVPEFVADLRLRKATSARALEFCILGANRTGEVIGATWREIDLEAKVWTIPAERMKMGFIHRVPLTQPMTSILDEMAPGRPDDYVFPSAKLQPNNRPGPLSNMAMMELLKRMNLGQFTVHGYRSCFRDWSGEETEHAESVAEAALAHSVGDATVRAYRRGDSFDRRRRLMDDWAAFVGGAPSSVQADADDGGDVAAPLPGAGELPSPTVAIGQASKRKAHPEQTGLF